MIWANGWIWISAALILGVLELMAPGYLFLGMGLAALVIGLGLMAGLAAPSLPLLLVIAALLSGAIWLILRRVMGVRQGQVRIWDRDINDN